MIKEWREKTYGISSERGNIRLDPFQSKNEILNTKVSGNSSAS